MSPVKLTLVTATDPPVEPTPNASFANVNISPTLYPEPAVVTLSSTNCCPPSITAVKTTPVPATESVV